MFCYQEKVNAGVPQVCTPEIWDSLIDSPAVANTCAAIAALDPNAADYADRKQALKKVCLSSSRTQRLSVMESASAQMLSRPVSPCWTLIMWIIRGK